MSKFFIDPPTMSKEGSKKPQGNRDGSANWPGEPETIVITGEDANHLARVLRAQPGQEISATDGQGHLYKIVLTFVTPEAVHGQVLTVAADHSEPEVKIALYQSILKGEKMDWVLQKGTELGISTFVPFLSSRTIARPTPSQYGKKRERWQKIVTAAAKQSGRGLIPTVQPVIAWAELPSLLAGRFTLVAWEAETTRSLRQVLAGQRQPAAVNLIIGPEGGFALDEVVTLTQQGAQSVSLGPRILRAETAGPLTAAIILYHYGALEPLEPSFST